MQLEIIDLSSIQDRQLPLVNEAYRLWVETYQPILEAAGESLKPEYFFRSKTMIMIRDEEKVLSFSLNNVLNLGLSGVSDLSYFQEMPLATFEQLRSERFKLFTIEWVTVHPDFRARMTKIQQADLIMGLSINSMTHTDCDGAIGYSRIDLGADRIASRFGARAQEPTLAHGVECNVMLARREWVIPHKFKQIQAVVDGLWNEQINTSSLIKQGPMAPGAAAA
ncbi:MAG: hypothetical protein EON58_15135 [Alphaproteobacteria bacterium]|nr:MAG: hypothetical protein EON58_15135 [Alphaproteobacteria bacterium]